MPFEETSIKDFGSLLQNSTIPDAANRPDPSNQTKLDFKAGDFSFFKPYVFGQYSSLEQQTGTVEIPSASGSSMTVDTITGLDMKCTEQDLLFVDFSGCDPTDPAFVSSWTSTGALNQAENTPTNVPNFAMAGIKDALTLQKQCFRSHYCANSLLSKSLQTLQSTQSGHKARFQDLEDVYFRECLNIFNMTVAMIYFIVIIISKLVYKTQEPTIKPTK